MGRSSRKGTLEHQPVQDGFDYAQRTAGAVVRFGNHVQIPQRRQHGLHAAEAHICQAQAKLHIQDAIRDGKLELVSSYMLWYEISKNPFPVKRSLIGCFIEEYTSVFVEGDEDGSIRETARQVMGTGVKSMDAYHVACAIHAGCNYLVTTDRRLLKYGDARIKLVNPVDFVAETEA